MLEQLNQQAAIDDRLTFIRHPSGLVQGVVRTELCSGSFFLLGAHVAEFQPAGQSPVLFMSEWSRFEEGAPIRGGIPICFPWFGPHPDNPDAPAHGLVRTQVWQVTDTSVGDNGSIAVTLELSSPPWKLSYRVQFGRELDVQLSISNAGPRPEVCEAALHTYFQLDDSRSARIFGLESLDYFDKLTASESPAAHAPLVFSAETDRIYFGNAPHIELQEPGLPRTISLRPRQSASTVVWNPWIDKSQKMPDFGDVEYLRMCCIETARVGRNRIELSPEQTEDFGVCITQQE